MHKYSCKHHLCTIGQKIKKNKKEHPTNSNANYRREMKLLPNNIDYCLLQFDALKFFLRVHLDGGGSLKE